MVRNMYNLMYNLTLNCKYTISNKLYKLHWNQLIKDNIHLKGLYKNSTIFIVGAGPSLKKQNLKFLENQIYIGVTTAYYHPDLNKAKKSFWISIDPYLQWQNSYFEMQKILEQNTDGATYFMPVQAKKINEDNGLFIDRKIIYMAYKNTLNLKSPIPDSRIDLCDTVYSAHNTVETAIVCAAYMGAKRIVLLGCDSDWFLYRNNGTVHFYPETKTEKKMQSEGGIGLGMEKKLYYGYLLYKSYRRLNEIMLKKNILIQNATEGGMLDVFPEISLSNIIQSD